MRLFPLILLLLLPAPAPAKGPLWIWVWSPTGWSAQSFVRLQQPGAFHPQFQPLEFINPPAPQITTIKNSTQTTPLTPLPPTTQATDPLLSNTAPISSVPAAANLTTISATSPPSRWSFNLPWLGILDISSGIFLTSPGFMQPILIHHPLPLPVTASEPEYFIQDHAIRPWLEPGSGQFYITFQTAP